MSLFQYEGNQSERSRHRTQGESANTRKDNTTSVIVCKALGIYDEHSNFRQQSTQNVNQQADH